MAKRRCPECGNTMKGRREKSYRYAESGLPSVYLLNAVMVYTCSCGDSFGFQALGQLHRQIAAALIRKRSRLAAEEIRFLRKLLGWSGVVFAGLMGTTAETVSRWENGQPMGAQADRLLRLLVVAGTPGIEYRGDLLAQIATDGPARPVKVELEYGPRGPWTFRASPGLIDGGTGRKK